MLSMDAQRFDLTKSSRNNPRHLIQPESNHEETLELQDTLSFMEFFSSSFSESSITIVDPDTSLQVFDNPLQDYDLSKRPNCQTPSPETSPATITYNWPTLDLEDDDSSSNTDVECDQAPEIDHSEDKETTDEYNCSIVRPRPCSPILKIFSRPSSPISFTSRPGSPINFTALNCFGNSDNFEEGVEILQAQLAKRAEVRVFVTQTRKINRERSWRTPLPELLYGVDPEPEGQARVVVPRD